MIRITDLSIGYDVALLRAAHLELEAGKVYALVGRNGIGKSTFIQTIVGVQKCISGEITLNGQSLSMLTTKEISEVISLVDTRFEGVEYLKVKDYLALGRAPFTDAFGRLGNEDLRIVHEVAADLSIEHLLEKYTDQISDGERQLCSVGRAFVQETPVILLDEPTAFLDYMNRQKLVSLLVRLSREKNKCMVLSTHDLDLCLEQSVPFLLASNGRIDLHLKLSKEEIIQAMT